MPVRVHDLAKELKISTSALKAHLKDLNTEVKSHMSLIEDDVANKLRSMFLEQAAAVRQQEVAKRQIQEKAKARAEEVVKATEKKPDPSPFDNIPDIPYEEQEQPVEVAPPPPPRAEKPVHKPTRVESTQLPEDRVPTMVSTPQSEDKVEKARKEIPTYVEKQIKKAPMPQAFSAPAPNGSRPPRPEQPSDDQRPNPPRYDGPRREYTPRQGGAPDGQRREYTPRQGGAPDGQRREGQHPDGYRPQGQGYRPQGQGQGYRPQGQGQGYRPQGQGQGGPRPQGQGSRPYSPRPQGQGGRPYPPRPQGQGGRPPVAPATEPVADGNDKKFAKAKKVDTVELGSKSKHIQAKLKTSNKKTKKVKKFEPTEEETAEISRNIRVTMAQSRKKKIRYKREDRPLGEENEKEIIIQEFTSVSELAKLMSVQPTEIIAKFFQMGQMVTINQRLDKDALEMICDEFDFDVQFKEEYGTELLEKQAENVDESELEPRPPVVTVMGHVDHGKTSILDCIRDSNVIAGESGGITQHIGAYQVEHSGRKITFLDTPGHEAFTAMRARGANITDIALIVVAANDGVKPQTIEALDHARAAGVTMIVVINKIDLPEANIERTISGLAEQKVYLENWGGDVLWTKTSAATGEGIPELLDLILLAADMKELKAPVDAPGKGVVIESRKDTHMGTVSTILLQEGTLNKGDCAICGATWGRIRKMENERGQEVKHIHPSDIAVVYGLADIPKAGDIINSVDSERTAKQISNERQLIRHERQKYLAQTNFDNLFQKIKEHEMTELRLIVKADTDGSVEALCDSFERLSNEEIAVNIIRRAVGGIIEADIELASASDAVIVGFHVRANTQAKKLSEEKGVEIKLYQIIYDAIEDVQSAITGLQKPVYQEVSLGTAEVKQIFRIKKVGVIAGCAVTKGVMARSAQAKVYRNDVQVFDGKVASLHHYESMIEEVRAGTDCGITLENFTDFKEGDVIEAYRMEEVKKRA